MGSSDAPHTFKNKGRNFRLWEIPALSYISLPILIRSISVTVYTRPSQKKHQRLLLAPRTCLGQIRAMLHILDRYIGKQRRNYAVIGIGFCLRDLDI